MDLTGVILLTGIGLVIGFLVAALIFSLRKESAPQEQLKKQVFSDAENKVRIWREGGDDRLVVEMNGVSYRQGSKMQSEQKKVLADIVKEIQAWLSVSTAAAAVVAPPVETKEPLNEQVEVARDNQSLNPLKIFGDALQPQKKIDGGDQDLSIVAQIDQILQTKIEGTHLEDKGIKLIEGPDQGMVIEIGLDKYNEIDAVPDEEVRGLIRLAVADWERSVGG